jgi:hypothetical protein
MALVIAGRRVEPQRVCLRGPEAAFLLGCTGRDIRNMLWRGVLRAVRAGRTGCPDIAEVAERLADDPCALEALIGIVEGRLTAPRLASLDTRPPPLTCTIEGPR